jgi:hypothetical protein
MRQGLAVCALTVGSWLPETVAGGCTFCSWRSSIGIAEGSFVGKKELSCLANAG